MAPLVVKSRFHKPLDMVAVRTMGNETVAQSGTDLAWCRGDSPDSPTLGHMAFLHMGTRPQESSKPSSSSKSRLVSSQCSRHQMMEITRLYIQAVQAANVAPLNIKKIRRRALTNASSIDLGLPPSPLPPVSSGSEASSSASPPPTGFTFTAEWDLTKKSFIFTPLRDAHSPMSSASPRSARSAATGVPVNVDDELLSNSTLASPSLYSPSVLSPHPDLSTVSSPVTDSESAEAAPTTAPSAENREECSPSPVGTPVSSIFDRDSLYSSHKRHHSRSSAASSVISLVDMELDSEKQKARRALPPKPDLCLDTMSSPLKALDKSLLATKECGAHAASSIVSFVDMSLDTEKRHTRRALPSRPSRPDLHLDTLSSPVKSTKTSGAQGIARSASERSPCDRPSYAQRPLPRIPRTRRRLPDVPRNAASMYESVSQASPYRALIRAWRLITPP